MRIYVINLPRSTDRRRSIERQLERAGLSAEFIPAIDGRDLTEDDLARVADAQLRRDSPVAFTPTLISIVLNQLSAYRRILEDGEDAGLVLEDDATLDAGLGDLLGRLEPRIAPDELTLLHYRAVVPCRLSTQDATDLGDGYELLYPVDWHLLSSAAGFIMGREACKRILDRPLPLRFGPDWWPDHYRDGTVTAIRCVHPRPIGIRTDLSSAVDYLGPWWARVSDFAARHRVFPVHQILTARRAKYDRASMFRLVDERSPIASGEPSGAPAPPDAVSELES